MFPYALLIDGDPSTFFSTGNNPLYGELWVQIHLGTLHKIGMVEIVSRVSNDKYTCGIGCSRRLENTKVTVGRKEEYSVSCGIITGIFVFILS